MPQPAPKYAVGTNLVCVSEKDQTPYEARIIGIDTYDTGEQFYTVHYKGWNSRHNERVDVGKEEGRLFEGTLASLNGRINVGAARPKKVAKKAKKAAPVAPKAPVAKPAAPVAKPAAPAAPTAQSIMKQIADIKSDARKLVAQTKAANAAKAAQAAKPKTTPKRKAAAKPVTPKVYTPSVNFTNLNSPPGNTFMYTVGEEFVYLQNPDPPLPAKVIDIHEHHGLMKYVCHITTQTGSVNEQIRVGSENGRMAKGTVAEYLKKNPLSKQKKEVNPKADNMPDEEDQAGAGPSQPSYVIGENFVCIAATDKIAHEAKVTDIQEHRGQMKYVVHFKGLNNRYDEMVPINATQGKMFKGTLKEHHNKYGPPKSRIPVLPKRAEPASEAESSSEPGPSKKAKKN